MYYMKASNEIKSKRMDKIITLRMRKDDYLDLLNISEKKKSDVSKIIRNILEAVIDVAKENNSKVKRT
jgi:hypothetical protein